MIKDIASLQNSIVKEAAELNLKKYRSQRREFLVEGVRAVQEAINSGWELTAIFFDDTVSGEKISLMLQHNAVSCYHEDVDFYDMKGVLEGLMEKLQVADYKLIPVAEPFLHPGKSCAIECEGKIIGYFGEVHPTVEENFELGAVAYLLEIEIEPLVAGATTIPQYQRLPKFPSTSRDIAVVVPTEVSMWFLFIVVTLYFMSSLLSKGYLDKEATRGYLKRKNTFIGKYYALFTMFVWTMFLVLVTKNLGLMWVCIEATTLVSALLVSFKHTRGALEAAWKYIMVCTVGICLALLGTIILYYAQLTVLGAVKPLDWLWLKQNAVLLNPNLLRMSFLFIIIGYGTKIGLAPMHTWLPDAYSQAPSLISGLLSGALCACAIYVLMRNLVIIVPAVGIGFILNILYVFAFLTVAIAVPFAIVQRDIKRLLAYSSMENIGIMIIGLAIFTNNSVSAVLLHLFNHGLIVSNLGISRSTRFTHNTYGDAGSIR